MSALVSNVVRAVMNEQLMNSAQGVALANDGSPEVMDGTSFQTQAILLQQATVWNHRRYWLKKSFVISVTLLLLVSLAAVIVLSISGVGTRHSDTSRDDPIRRFNDIVNLLERQGILDNSTIANNTMSPQYLAIEWLAEKDPNELIPSATSASSLINNQIVQRYILAVLFISTGGLSGMWGARNGNVSWLQSGSVCEWSGISCNDQSIVTSVRLGTYVIEIVLPCQPCSEEISNEHRPRSKGCN